jgi:hypothetical protein
VSVGEAILGEVAGWEGVTVEAGGRVGYRGGELGRVGPDSVEVRFHPRLRAMLVETGRAAAHADPDRVVAGHAEAVELFRLAYERARVAERVRRR